MELCKDCGHKNVGALYCVKCGNELFTRKRSPEKDSVILSLAHLLPFSKRN